MKIVYWGLVLFLVVMLLGQGVLGILAAVVLFTAAGMLYVAKIDPEAGTEAKQEKSAKPSRLSGKGPVHCPPPPQGQPLEPWCPQGRENEVAGEFYRLDNIHRLFRHTRIDGPEGAEMRHPAVLVPDGGNPYDANAVAVFVEGLHVGYLERANAAIYHRAVAEVARHGRAAMVESRQWARKHSRGTAARVTVRLPIPGGFLPANPIPPGSVILPVGAAVQVTQEDKHMDVLSPWVQGRGEVALAVTLHSITVQRAKSSAKVLEARVDGQRVGVLSAVQTANLSPLVDLVSGHGKQAVARAIAKGDSSKADVVLFVAKAKDLGRGDWDELSQQASS